MLAATTEPPISTGIAAAMKERQTSSSTINSTGIASFSPKSAASLIESRSESMIAGAPARLGRTGSATTSSTSLLTRAAMSAEARPAASTLTSSAATSGEGRSPSMAPSERQGETTRVFGRASIRRVSSRP